MQRLGPKATKTMWKSTKELEEELSVQQGEKNIKKRRWFPENKVKKVFAERGSD